MPLLLPIHSKIYTSPFVSHIGVADSSALIGGASPLLRGMNVIAIGSCYVNGATPPTVNVPTGWTNVGFHITSSGSDRSAIAMWTKKLNDDESPDFFTTHDQAQMHYYGFWDDAGPPPFSTYSIPTIVRWNIAADSNMSPELGDLDAIGSKPFLIVGGFRSTGAITTDTITYNLSDQVQTRNAFTQANNSLVSRINYVNNISDILNGEVTFDMGDHGIMNVTLGFPLIIN